MTDNTGFDSMYMNAGPSISSDNEKRRTDGIYKETNKAQGSPRLTTTNNVRNDEMDDSNDDLYVNEAVTDILIEHLESAIAVKQENENNGFRKEYTVGFISLIYFLIYVACLKI